MHTTKSFVSKADLNYTGIDRIPEAGMPIGNGRMTNIQLNACAMSAQATLSPPVRYCRTKALKPCLLIMSAMG